MTERRGGCLCGGVRYRVIGELRPVVYCHCSQCRRTSGHIVAASGCQRDALTFDADATLSWYRSSSRAERGFCATCGGNLFWRAFGGNNIAIMAGTLDVPTGLVAIAHIFVADASDYHDIADGLAQYDDGGPAELGTES